MGGTLKLLILLSGDCPKPELVRELSKNASAVLCADGGVRHAMRLGLLPRFIIGDMDSLPAKLPRWPDATYLCDFDEDASDFEKALRFAGQAKGAEVIVAGALGGRIDHELVNLSLIERYSRTLRITLMGRGLARLVGPGKHELRCRRGEIISLLACTPSAILTTTGLRYPLRREKLLRGSRGLSNRALSSRAAVQVHRGKIWIIRDERRAV